MNTPTVSFVVPCYKLGHLLAECVNSILAQTYSDFEVLIMDDSSPDNTAEVASSFRDPRVKHVRNKQNAGHLRNYNKGIQLSQGKYVWLISADDYLRRPYILERYVQMMEKHPEVGYSFCPGVAVKDNRETGVLGYSVLAAQDRVINGPVFLETLVNRNIVIAASVLVRRECYEHISLFPLNAVWAGRQVEMGWAGDWYLWCVFALSFDVAYFAEPMVCYRDHGLSMTTRITNRDVVHACAAADIAVPWMIKQKAEERGMKRLSKACLGALANEYSRQATSKWYQSSELTLPISQIENSICHSSDHKGERHWIRARIFDRLADRYWFQGDLRSAWHCYFTAVREDPSIMKVYGKLALLPFGRLGLVARQFTRQCCSRVSASYQSSR